MVTDPENIVQHKPGRLEQGGSTLSPRSSAWALVIYFQAGGQVVRQLWCHESDETQFMDFMLCQLLCPSFHFACVMCAVSGRNRQQYQV